MARRQGAARDRGSPPALSRPPVDPEPNAAPFGASGEDEPAPALTVAVQDLAQARAALEAAAELGLAIALATAPGLVAMAGVGFCVALERAIGRPLLIDVGSEPGTALAALRAGARRLLLVGGPAARGKLEDIARQLGARLLHTPPAPLLVLGAGEDPRAALPRALAPAAGADPSSAAAERL